jgi:hypothetical protein
MRDTVMVAARDKAWENPDLLVQYMDCAYAAGKDKQGHEAFARLLELQKQGRCKPGLLEAKSVPEVQAYFQRLRARQAEALSEYQNGVVPREGVANALGRPLYLDWALRTQPLPAGFPDTLISQFFTYATNLLAPIPAEDSPGEPRTAKAPSDAQEIVVDFRMVPNREEIE